MNILNLILLSLCFCVSITFIVQKYIFKSFDIDRKNVSNDMNDIVDLTIDNDFITLGTILITDAVIGSSRDLSVSLSKSGLHILAGVKTKSEERSFFYDRNNKGLEPIVFDLFEPSTIASTLYRIRSIRKDLYRPLRVVVINLADMMLEHLYQSSLTTNDINDFDKEYKSIVKGPLKLLEMVIGMMKGDEDDTKIIEAINIDKKTIEDNNNDENDIDGFNNDGASEKDKEYDIGGRIILVISSYFSDNHKGCGSKCILHDTFLSLANQLRNDLIQHNINISVITSDYTPSIDGNNRYNKLGAEAYKHTEWVIEEETSKTEDCIDNVCINNNINDDKIIMELKRKKNDACVLKSTLHSVLSMNPLNQYYCDKSNLNEEKTINIKTKEQIPYNKFNNYIDNFQNSGIRKKLIEFLNPIAIKFEKIYNQYYSIESNKNNNNDVNIDEKRKKDMQNNIKKQKNQFNKKSSTSKINKYTNQ